MMRWIITALVAALLLAAGFSAHWWAPQLLPFLKTENTEIDSAVKILSGIGAAVAFLVRLWLDRRKRQKQSGGGNVSQTAHAGRDAIQVTGNSRIGGVHFDSMGNPSIAGDVAGGDITKIIVEQSRRALTARKGLQSPVSDFVGREREIEGLVRTLSSGGRAGIAGIRGMGGIGKTELALLVARKLSNDFPDAQLFIDLYGKGSSPLDPSKALASLIRAAEETDAKLPEGLDELKRIYLNCLNGKRTLILLDDAASDDQVRPLLPPPTCGLLVTSREAIALPRLKPLTLDQLLPDEARKLLASAAQRAMAAGVAEEICRLCGYLPLAVRAAGGQLNTTPDLDLAQYAKELRDERTRLERIGEVGVDIGVEATLNLSYKRLATDPATVFRCLAVFPGSFDAIAEQTVCEDSPHAHLSTLVKRSLVLYDDSTRRYRLHDLVRVFADARLERAERAVAERRHAEHYKNVLAASHQLYLKGGESVTQGLALFDLEWGNIQAGQAWAAAHASEDMAAAELGMRYPDAGVHCLSLRLHPREHIRWLETALASARRLQNRQAEGAHLGNLGIAYRLLGECRRAIDYHEKALVIDREIGDRRGEGQDLGNLGNAYDSLGENRCAIEYHEQFLKIAREIGDRRGEGIAWSGQGNAYQSLGEYRRAIEYHEQALAIDREIGYRKGEGQDLGNLGIAYDSLGDHRRAIEYHEQHLQIAREIGDRRGEGTALGNLGNAYHSLGEYRRAIEYYEQQLQIGREIGHRNGEGQALWNMSLALDKLGERAKAMANAEAALKIYEQIEHASVEKVRKRLAEWRGNA